MVYSQYVVSFARHGFGSARSDKETLSVALPSSCPRCRPDPAILPLQLQLRLQPPSGSPVSTSVKSVQRFPGISGNSHRVIACNSA